MEKEISWRKESPKKMIQKEKVQKDEMQKDRFQTAIQKEKVQKDRFQDDELQEKPERSVFREILSYVWIIVIAAVLAMLVNRYVLINAVIPSESMENLLMVDDRLFGCRLSYLFEGPERYDVVMFTYPVDGKTVYIKRVIGLPGETVEIRNGGIYIDGSDTPIEENYLPEEWVYHNDGYIFEVPDDCYLMLGDNRNISEDARDWAQCAVDNGVAADIGEGQKYVFVHKDKIIGRAVLKYYPKFHLFLNI